MNEGTTSQYIQSSFTEQAGERHGVSEEMKTESSKRRINFIQENALKKFSWTSALF